jgi:probable HAF family extracellular repeat protein
LAACGTERPMTGPSLQEHPEAASASTAYRAIDLGTLGGPTAAATAINAAGQIVGYSTNKAGKTRAFLWAKGTLRGLGHLGGGHSWAYGINKAGQVVGKSLTASGEYHAFIWTNGVMKDLGTLGGSSSLAADVDSLGRVVGSSDTGKEWPWESRAILWRKNGTIVDLVVWPATPVGSTPPEP